MELGLSLGFLKDRQSDFVNFNLSASLPSGMTYTRNDAVATYRDSAGVMQVSAVNTPRFDHTSAGIPLGMLFEDTRQNKCTDYNANPTDTTGWTKAGDANATFTVVSDTVALGLSKLNGVCSSGNVYKLDNSLGSGVAYVTNSGTTGNTNNHSYSIYARGDGTGVIGDLRRSGSGATLVDINAGAVYSRVVNEDMTSDGTSNALRVVADAGKVVYFILAQQEEAAFCSTPIVTAGATATRELDLCSLALSGKTYFDESQGFLIARYFNAYQTGADQFPAVIHDDSTDDTIGFEINGSDNELRGYVRASGAGKHTTSTNDAILIDTLNITGITWKTGDTTLLSGGLSNNQTYSGDPTGLVTLNIGGRNAGASPLWGHIKQIKIGKTHKSVLQLGGLMHDPNDIVLVGAGQSLMVGHFNSQETNSEAGKQKHREVVGQAIPASAFVFVTGATGGSAASKTTSATNYWWDLATSARGPAFDTFYANIAAAGVQPNAVIWAQGEADSHQIGGNTSRAQYKAATEAVFADMRATLGDVPIFFQRIGRRSDFTNTGGVQVVREVQQEIIDENDWCYETCQIYDLGLIDETGVSDAVHPNDAAYLVIAQRNARRICDYFSALNYIGLLGPSMTAAERSGTTVTVTITHDGGTDFTPTSAIEGFTFFDDGVEIAINAAVRTDANTITLTLASAPTGVEELYYAYDAMLNIDNTKILKDNASTSLPLRPAKITL